MQKVKTTKKSSFSLRQKELAKWQLENFGEQSPYRHALGVAEEIGELCHLVLKREQLIRKSANGAGIKADIADAFSDYVIYGIQMMTSLNLDAAKYLKDLLMPSLGIASIPGGGLCLCLKELPEWIKTRKEYNNVERLTLEIFKEGGRLVKCVTEYQGNAGHAFSEVVMLGVILMKLEGIDAEKVLAETIEMVMQRDWRKYPVDGKSK